MPAPGVTATGVAAQGCPGPAGPHRARSEARRVQFLSTEDYLAQIEKQKRRLLNRIRTVYREEREVHDLLRDLDPAAEVFVQTCQLEAVRQDLIRERLRVIRGRIDFLVEDLAANKVSEEAESAALAKLGTELQRIEEEHVGKAASLLRELAAVDGEAPLDREPATKQQNEGATHARQVSMIGAKKDRMYTCFIPTQRKRSAARARPWSMRSSTRVAAGRTPASAQARAHSRRSTWAPRTAAISSARASSSP